MVYAAAMPSTDTHAARAALPRATALAQQYAALDHVQSVALAGSRVVGTADAASGIDLYVYATARVPLAGRAAIAAADAQAEIDNRWFGPEDAWVDPQTGFTIDVVFRTVAGTEEAFTQTLVRHEAQLGYSTAVWATILASRPLVDPTGWLARLQQQAQQSYPEPLRQAIIAFNLPLLRQAQSAYGRQLAKAVAREDRVSVNHRVAALLASYFDILFALNRLPHPGEKRQLAVALTQCPLVPPDMAEQLDGLLQTAGQPGSAVLHWAKTLSTALEQLVRQFIVVGD